MKNTILILGSFLMLACHSNKRINAVETKVEPVIIESPTLELAQGKTHYQNQCANCHDLFDPFSKTEEQWKAIVPQMAEYINGAEQVMDDKTQASILNYLVLTSKNK